ncbi:hypothetical protein TorRG33x02_029830 [Trema orientale]|uniref:Uncharacterized protein n=1 Tax=Trema orientale TaxID=63057 RepID=A0A2P5FTY7_TREOI|nr:hypothetical protein TorRG33x02_029830 [Trema orientale]
MAGSSFGFRPRFRFLRPTTRFEEKLGNGRIQEEPRWPNPSIGLESRSKPRNPISGRRRSEWRESVFGVECLNGPLALGVVAEVYVTRKAIGPCLTRVTCGYVIGGKVGPAILMVGTTRRMPVEQSSSGHHGPS